ADELRSHTGRRQVPTTLVALEGDRLLGSVSLLADDLPGWEHLSPWVASVFVEPSARRRGVGPRLGARAVEEAGALGIATGDRDTPGQQDFYAAMGWELLASAALHGHAVAVMRRPTGLRVCGGTCGAGL